MIIKFSLLMTSYAACRGRIPGAHAVRFAWPVYESEAPSFAVQDLELVKKDEGLREPHADDAVTLMKKDMTTCLILHVPPPSRFSPTTALHACTHAPPVHPASVRAMRARLDLLLR